MYLLIDNYDSFVYNLAAYLREEGEDVQVTRCDAVRRAAIEALYQGRQLKGIIISPGPKRPEENHIVRDILRDYEGRVPILGVCLGHQMIAHHYGAVIEKGERPMHGKVTQITHTGSPLFKKIPQTFQVTRYHSLVVAPETLPGDLRIDGVDDQGTIMAIGHRKHPIYGVQFHPEAVMTEFGHQLVRNFMTICKGEQNDDPRS
ncbi:anthranilate synthase component II [Eubacterium aggregans]|uniref:anthranilate synthase component II n=1 Tax=Eubacterium aggregans TaxID=81409 RepID=UPI003F2C8256